jgi:hypothetical protein
MGILWLCEWHSIERFYFRVKRSIWTLQQISAKQLVESLEQSERQRIAERSDDDVEEEEDEDEKLDSDLLIHRILLLRSWLFHFVGNVHSYFMTRVLHSTEIELRCVSVRQLKLVLWDNFSFQQRPVCGSRHGRDHFRPLRIYWPDLRPLFPPSLCQGAKGGRGQGPRPLPETPRVLLFRSREAGQ